MGVRMGVAWVWHGCGMGVSMGVSMGVCTGVSMGLWRGLTSHLVCLHVA
jgi:hypothetical protein